MNITPRNIFKGTNSDGTSFRAEEWDFNTLVQIELVEGLCILLVLTLLSSITPLLFLIWAISLNGRAKAISVIAMAIGTYFLIDCTYGWVIFWVLDLCFSEPTINSLIGINIGCLFAHTIILLFGNAISDKLENSKPMLIGIMCLVMFVGYVFGANTHTKGWINRVSHPTEVIIEDHRTSKQIEDDANESYRQERIKNGDSPVNEFEKNRGE